jgi:hypothetical protein
MTTNEIKIYVPSESMDFFYGNDINICVPADDVEHPVELIPNLDNIIFDFKKIITKPARKYVEINIVDLYNYASPMYDEHTFDIENEADKSILLINI